MRESKGAKAAAGRAIAAYPLDNDAEAEAIYASHKLEQQAETKQIGFN
ncbi:hypothetical protein [Methylomonas koyamae]|nr:hypothetical protein [Methylomonas koyamae]